MENYVIPIPKGFVKDESKSDKENFVLKYVGVEITEISSLAEAIEYLTGNDDDVITYHKKVSVGIEGHDLRYTEIVIIIKAVNKLANGGKKWIPDWDNENEKKWWGWFKMGSGFGLSVASYVSWTSPTYVGSRLCLINKEVAIKTINMFINKFKEFLTIKK